jgi:hypothetical protein
MLLRLLALARAPVELAEAEAAVSDERTHAELIGQGQRVTVARLSVLHFPRFAPRGDLAQQPERLGLVAALPVLSRDLEGTLGPLQRPLDLVSKQVSLAEPGDPERRQPVPLLRVEVRRGLLEERVSILPLAGEQAQVTFSPTWPIRSSTRSLTRSRTGVCFKSAARIFMRAS